jgi:NAD(P)-dependent dehydrogenase (short-subunit alcohol dehydrogenase family)
MAWFRDKLVVVTGAASGIGRATAHAFAREGAHVVLCDLDGARLAEVQAELDAAGLPAESHELDCTCAEAVEDLAAHLFARHGRVHVLHNNAGVVHAGPAEAISLEDWRWVLDTNLWTVVHGVRAFVPRMIAAGGGHLVNTASMAGLVGLPRVSAYCASKAAVVGYSEALAIELGARGIHVTLVCPGAVRTGLFEAGRITLPGDLGQKLGSLIARFGADPERVGREIVEAVHERRFLCTPGSVEMAPLWWLKRGSTRVYTSLLRSLTALATRP